jgi:cyclohexyl-isocyanide hydratase
MSEKPDNACHIAMVAYPRLTQLDLTGPYEILARMPGATVDLVWSSRDPIVSDTGLVLVPTATFEDCPQPEILFVPGGPGQVDVMENATLIGFLGRMAPGAKLVTSVCTGSLLLGAAGLLRGKRATCHWMSLDLLSHLGAMPTNERVVIDGNVITAAGVSSGIDFALTVAAELHGEATARQIQLFVEYDPQPPFDSGSQEKAHPETVESLRTAATEMLARRATDTERLGLAMQNGAG